MNTPYAVIDLGTNTFHLLIGSLDANAELTVHHREQIPVKLLADGYEGNSISAVAYERGLAAIERFRDLLANHQAELVAILGTSGLRNATNAPDFLATVKNLLECPVQLIDGEQEALLIYEGVRTAVSLPEKPSLILDIGGGSVELIVGNPRECLWKKSLEIGAARLLQQFPHHFPVTPKEQKAIQEYVGEALAPVLPAIKAYNPQTLIGASGFFETFVQLDRHQQAAQPEKPLPRSYTLPLERFAHLKSQVLNKNQEELEAMRGMESFRVPMMGVSTLLTDYLLQQLPLQFIEYANYAMKEGALAAYLKGEHVADL